MPSLNELKSETAESFEINIFNLLLIIQDFVQVMKKKNFSLYRIYELCKEHSFEKLAVIYQKAVDLVAEAKRIGAEKKLGKLLKIFTWILISLLSKFFKIDKFMDCMRQISRGMDLDLKLIGFTKNEDLYVSVMAYAIEIILYKTRYYEYKSAFRFLSECVKPGFKILLEAFKQLCTNNIHFKEIIERIGNHGERRFQREAEIPRSMIEQIVNMGFEAQQAEEALRMFDFDIDTAINDLLRRREESAKSFDKINMQPSSISKEIEMRKIEMKNLPVEIDQWISSLFINLYESIYSISTFKCNYILYFLANNQSIKSGFKITKIFEFFLNELQTLISCIEATYKFHPIPNDEFPIKEVAELLVTNKLKEKIQNYVSNCGITQEAYLVLQKIETLISVMTTFLRHSKNNELIKLMCDNKIGECLIFFLGKLLKKEMFIPGRKLFSKILILLSMIFKETYQQMQSELLDKKMRTLSGKESEIKSIKYSLPTEAEIGKLLEFLCHLLDNEKLISEILKKMKKKKNEILSAESVTSIILLLTNLTKDPQCARLVANSKILERLLQKNSVSENKEIPTRLISELIFNLLESPEMLEKYMERIISRVLFSNIKTRPSAPPTPEELLEMQKESAIDLNTFLKGLDFLMFRNSFIFFKACQNVSILRKKIESNEKVTTSEKVLISLRAEQILSIEKEFRPNSLTIETALKDSQALFTTTHSEIITELLLRLGSDELVEEIKSTEEKKIISEKQILQILTKIIRVYPESLALILSFEHKNIPPKQLIGRLLQSSFPRNFIQEHSEKIEIKENNEWKQCVNTFVKYLTYFNPKLHNLSQQILLQEMRQTVVSEILKILHGINSQAKKKKINYIDGRSIALAYSTLSLCEGLLVCPQTSVLLPRDNEYYILREMFKHKQSLMKECSRLLKYCNLHSANSQLIVNCISNVMERISRFNRLFKKEINITEENHPPVKNEEIKFSSEPEAKVQRTPILSLVELGMEPDQKESKEEIHNEQIEVPHPMEVEDSTSFISSDSLNEEDMMLPGDSDEENRPLSSSDEESEDDEMPRIREMRRMGLGLEEIEEYFAFRHIQIKKKQSKESDSIQVQISGLPLDNYKTVPVYQGLRALYEIEEDSDTNFLIAKLLKDEVFEEEESASQDRNNFFSHLNPHDPVHRIRRRERDELPIIPLFGYAVDEQKISELTKKQMISGLEILVIQSEIPKPIEKKEEEKKIMPTEKIEEIQPESKTEEEKRSSEEIEALIEQRRREVEELVPGLTIGNNREVLLQIDIEVLRSLPSEIRPMAIQQIILESHSGSGSAPPPDSSEMDMATFIATIQDENLRDEALLSVSPEVLASLPQELQSRVESLHSRPPLERMPSRIRDSLRRSLSRDSKSVDFLEEALMVSRKGDTAEKEIIKTIHSQINKLGEETIEWLIRLLYMNLKNRIPLNALLFNICCSKKHVYKTISALIFILINQEQIEKHFHTTKVSSGAEKMPETKQIDTLFPPIELYQGMNHNHLIYSIISIRILSLLSAFLRSSSVCRYFFLNKSKSIALTKRKNELESLIKLRDELEDSKEIESTTPLTKLLSLILNNKIFRTSESHLQAATYFISELFERYEKIVKKSSKKDNLPMISEENIKQLLQICSFEMMNEKTCTMIGNIFQKLSYKVDATSIILRELDFLLQETSKQAHKEWDNQIKQLEMKHTEKETEKKAQVEDSRIEIKFGLIMKLLKKIIDGHLLRGEEEMNSIISRRNIVEDEDIDELSPRILKQKSSSISPEKLHSLRVRSYIQDILNKEVLFDAFSSLTDLITAISKIPSASENNSRKDKLQMKLLPSIESLIIAYDYFFKNLSEARKLMCEIQSIRKENPEKREILGKEHRKAYIFYKFHDQNHEPFNNLIRQMPPQNYQTIIKDFVLRFPTLLDFENKRNYFKSELKALSHENNSAIGLTVRRDNIFNDSYSALANLSPDEMKSKFKVKFKDEEGIDAGGVTKEWYTTLSRAMFNPDIGLFKKSDQGNTYQPDPKSINEPNHLSFFKFIGRIIGKALREGQILECYFTRALYKTLVSQPLTLKDMEDYDYEMYNSLVCIEKEENVELLGLTFSYSMDYFGKEIIKDLVENGKNIPVTNKNKHEFIFKLCKAKLYQEIQQQLEALLKGINDLVPSSLLSIFDYKEIELLISGLPVVDIADLKANTEYRGYTSKSKEIQWFWEILATFSSQEKAAFLQFVTGTSKIPLDGFRNLPGSSGVRLFTIERVETDSSHLPVSHTCFNVLELPMYPTKEILCERLLKAIKEGGEYLGLG